MRNSRAAPAQALQLIPRMLLIFVKGPDIEFVGWDEAPEARCFIDELLIAERKRP